MSQEDTQRWLKEVMSKIIDNLGPDIDKARYELYQLVDTVMSTQFYVRVKFRDRSKKNGDEEISLVLKRSAQTNPEIRRGYCMDSQFYNEIVFYRTYAQLHDNLPRCYYVDYRPPTDSVIALENIVQRGYHPCPYTMDVPLEYTLAIVRVLARFHGKGYVMKELRREEFLDIVAGFRKTRFEEVPYDNIFGNLIGQSATRAVEYLRRHGYDADFCDKTEALFSNAMENVMMEAIQPREPLCTLCHGDFTVSNMFFKAEDDGKYSAMLIDFACVSYLTPATDLSMYLCLFSPNGLTKDNFYKIMRVYHDTLKECLLDAGIQDVAKYSYEAFLDDFRKSSLYGFCAATSYLPICLGYSIPICPKKVFEMGFTAYANICKQAGGDEVSKILADTLLRLKELGCLEHVL
ncbi:hypothetical protein X777_04801 [Ooceraea biroi]|nr:hypothetical protein X777_04801 [Ooceraea biroi]